MLSTKNVSIESGVSKIIKPGNVKARILNIELVKGFNADSYHLQLNLETEPVGDDFIGFLVDKDDQNGPRYLGQIGKLRANQYAYETKTLPNGKTIDRDQSIIIALINIFTGLGLREKLDEVNADSIEEFVKEVNKLLDSSIYVYFCIAGKEWTNNEGYINYNLFLPKYDAKSPHLSLVEGGCTVFNESKHIIAEVKKAAVTEFEPTQDLPFGQ